MNVRARRVTALVTLPTVVLLWGCSKGGGGLAYDTDAPATADRGTTPALPSKADPAVQSVLRVCSDPNNLPFSNERGEGFENRIASLIARDLGVPVQYTWWPERRGFVRNTLKARTCDVVMQVPAGYELTEHTAP